MVINFALQFSFVFPILHTDIDSRVMTDLTTLFFETHQKAGSQLRS